jgi:hypothetical protein
LRNQGDRLALRAKKRVLSLEGELKMKRLLRTVVLPLVLVVFAAAGFPLAAAPHRIAKALPSCVPSAEVACLQNGRFGVSLTWAPPGAQEEGNSVMRPFLTFDADGKVVESQEQAWASFYGSDLEVLVRVIDACVPALGNRYWVFASPLTNVQWSLEVGDYRASLAINYWANQGQIKVVQDTEGFDCNPP